LIYQTEIFFHNLYFSKIIAAAYLFEVVADVEL